jgi:hypothetical protein
VKLICDSRLKTKDSSLLCSTILHIEEVLVKISVWRTALDIKITGLEPALDIKTTGLEIGTGL